MKIINTTNAIVNDYYDPTGHALGDDFMAAKHHFVVVTDEQARSFVNLIRRQGIGSYKDSFYNQLDQYLAVCFDGLFVGIEPDGYTHQKARRK